MVEIRTILVPVSFDEPSGTALDYAIGLAARLGASVHLVHVVDLPAISPPEVVGFAAPEMFNDLERSAREELDHLVEQNRDRGVPLATTLRVGTPASEIVALSQALPADLVVMGTHGRTGVTHALLGSVAERVVRTCAVPVLTIHTHRPRISVAA